MKLFVFAIFFACSVAGFSQSSTVEKWYKDAFAFYQKGELQKAIDLFEKIFAYDSTETNALDYKTILYNQTGQYAKAASGCAKLCTLFPTKDDFFGAACFNYMLINEPDIAQSFGKMAVGLNSYRFNNKLNLGHAYLIHRKTKEAIYWYIKALQLVTSRADFERTFIADFDIMDSLGLVNSSLIKQFKDGLSQEFVLVEQSAKATVFLDSVLFYSNRTPNTAEREKIIKWKNEFIEAESLAKGSRYDVVAAFAVDLGLNEYRNRNRATAMGYYFKKAEEIYRNGGDSLSQATLLFFLSNELLVYQKAENKYGKNEDALSYAMEGRALVEKYNLTDLNAISLHQLAEAYFQKDENLKALYCLHSLFTLSQKSNDWKGYFWATNGLSAYYAGRKQLDSALYYHTLCEKHFNKAYLTGAQKIEIKLNGFDLLYSSGRYRELLQQSSGLKNELQKSRSASYSSLCELWGECYSAMQKTDSAYYYYQTAVESHISYSKEVERNKDATLPLQVSEERMSSIWALCKIAASRNDAPTLFYWNEMMKDNFLRYLISFQYQPEYVTTLQKTQKSLPNDAAAIFYVGTNLTSSPGMAFDKENQKIGWVDGGEMLQLVQQYELKKTLARLLELTNKKAVSTKDSIGSALLLSLMQYYNLSNIVPGASRSKIKGKPVVDSSGIMLPEERKQLSKMLYRVYLKPFESIIQGKKTLYISADFMQHFIPFESLVLEDGRYVGEVYDIIYTPSFTIHEYLEGRKYNEGNSIVATGNPDYSTYHPELLQGRALDYSYLGIKSWTDLPGTKQELEMLQSEFDSVMIYTNQQLSETGLKQLSERGDLSKAAILHFALHGMAGTNSAKEDNSLVVTEPDDGKQDGLLQFYEAYELEIAPRLVCLSACETGLGMIDTDGSLATMGTAFLAAGAKAVLAANWSIDDAATSLFMKEVYQQVSSGNIAFSEAVANTKRKFIKGDFGEELKNPFYWAPFKYYGN